MSKDHKCILCPKKDKYYATHVDSEMKMYCNEHSKRMPHGKPVAIVGGRHIVESPHEDMKFTIYADFPIETDMPGFAFVGRVAGLKDKRKSQLALCYFLFQSVLSNNF